MGLGSNYSKRLKALRQSAPRTALATSSSSSLTQEDPHRVAHERTLSAFGDYTNSTPLPKIPSSTCNRGSSKQGTASTPPSTPSITTRANEPQAIQAPSQVRDSIQSENEMMTTLFNLDLYSYQPVRGINAITDSSYSACEVPFNRFDVVVFMW